MTPFLSVPEALSSAECDRIVAAAAAAQSAPAGLVGHIANPEMRRADLVWVDDLPGQDWLMERMVTLVNRANREGYGFDLTDFAESAQIAAYRAEAQGHFDWHSDIGAGPLAARRKITIVVQLSAPEEYEGGTLNLRPDSNIHDAPRTRGTAVLFPSFVLHRVTPVTRGLRRSLTLWAHGPAFR